MENNSSLINLRNRSCNTVYLSLKNVGFNLQYQTGVEPMKLAISKDRIITHNYL